MDEDPEVRIIRRELDTDRDTPAIEIARAVADIEGCEPTDLANMHDCVDGILDELFSTPPSPDAQMEVTFTYESYRISVMQGGAAEFVKVDAA